MMRALRRIAVCGLCALMTVGCWDQTELNNIGMVLGWGMDMENDGTYLSSAQLAIPAQLGGRHTSNAAGGGVGKGFFEVTAAGADILDAAQNMQSKLSRRIFASHRQVIVMGERLARHGVREVIDEYSRNPDVRLRTDIFVIQGADAKDFFNVPYPLESLPVQAALKQHLLLMPLADKGLFRFLEAASSEGSCPVLPAISLQSASSPTQGNASAASGFKITGLGVFNKKLQLVGFLNVNEAIYRAWVAGLVQRFSFTATVSKAGTVTLDATYLRSKIRPSFSDGRIRFYLTLTGSGMLRENETNLDLTKLQNLDKMERALDRQTQRRVLQTITKLQTQYQADVLGLGETIHQRYPSQWEMLKKEWPREFSRAEISVQVKLTIKQVGLTGPSLQLAKDDIQS